MSFFHDNIPNKLLLSNNFVQLFEIKSDYPAKFQDWCFTNYPPSYKKYRKFLAYSEPYTKHYMFDILCKEIDLNNKFDVDFIEYVNNNKYNDNNYKSIEFLFNKYHSMWKLFFVVKKNYDGKLKIYDLDTTKLYNIKNINDTKKNYENEEYYLSFIYNNNETNNNKFYRISQPDLETIIEFINNNKPLYMHILPENITHFSSVYIQHVSDESIRLFALSEKYLYCIYSQR